MNYLLGITLSCCLTITSTIAMAAGNTKNLLDSSGERTAILQNLSSIHLAAGGAWDEGNKQLSVEGFWPFFRQEQQLLFLQGGWQHQQQRNLLSVGLGWRYFPETHWGLGYHLFYDQDTTRQQRRVGLGAEAWWQSLKIAANGYLPINGWRESRDVKGYLQRSASGYDLALHGYLPAVPHLGASVRYVHYFGDEVALGGETQRYRNPKQWRCGIDLTPIPLLTLAYHRQAGLNGQSKHQISATLTYRFSLPLSQQLDPNQVTLLNSAEGQRLTRVLREQPMALKYAKMPDPPVPTIKNPMPPPPALTLDVEEVASDVEEVASDVEEVASDVEDVASDVEDVASDVEDVASDVASDVEEEVASETETDASPHSIARSSKLQGIEPLPDQTEVLALQQQLFRILQPLSEQRQRAQQLTLPAAPLQSPIGDQTQVTVLQQQLFRLLQSLSEQRQRTQRLALPAAAPVGEMRFLQQFQDRAYQQILSQRLLSDHRILFSPSLARDQRQALALPPTDSSHQRIKASG
jgi:Inverse autotransporter, beta-domain